MRGKNILPRAGLLCIGQEGEHNELALEFLRQAVPMLEHQGMDVIGSPDKVLMDYSQIVGAAKTAKDQGADFLLFLIGTWILADKVVDTIREVCLPVALWGIPEATSFSSVGANVLHGTFEELDIRHSLFYGFSNDEDLQRDLAAFAKAAKSFRRLRGSRLGMLGGRSISAYPTSGDPNQIKQVFGVEVQHIDQMLLLERARDAARGEVAAAQELFSKRYSKVSANDETLDKSLRVYVALKHIYNEYGLDFLAVKCLEEFIDGYTSCCVAVALLNDEGIVTTCQADLNGALSMFIMEELSGEPAIFGDVNMVDKQSSVVRMINCGSMPTRLAGAEAVEWVEQYAYMGKGRGVCPVFCCKQGPVTFGTFSRIRGEYVLLIAGGNAFEEPRAVYTQVRNWPQGFITLDADPMGFYHNLRSNHSVAGYGDCKKELRYISHLLDIPVTEV